MNTETKNPKRPTHLIYQVTGENEKSRWIRVGAGWLNKDGKQIYLRFDAYPVVGKTIVREYSEKDDRSQDEPR